MTNHLPLLNAALHRKGWNRAQLIGALVRAGHPVTRQRVGKWFDQGAVPDATIIGPLCDVFGFTESQAAEFYAACGYVLPASLRP